MKYTVLLLIPLLLFGFACNKGKIQELESHVATLEQENLELSNENAEINKFIEEVTKVLETVDRDLASIVEAETDVREMADSDATETQQIQTNLKKKLGLIGQYIVDSKERIQQLEEQLEKSNYDMKGLRAMVNNLKAKISTKEEEIATLQSEIGILETDIANLGSEIEAKDATIAQQEDLISEHNARYYIVDKASSLKEKGIIEKTGGFLFFGRVTTVSPNLDTQYFTKVHAINDTEFTFPYKADNLKFISPHAEGSYQLSGDDTQTILTITDPDEFWEASKCLVIAL